MSGGQLLFCYGLLPPFIISQTRRSACLYVQICPFQRVLREGVLKDPDAAFRFDGRAGRAAGASGSGGWLPSFSPPRGVSLDPTCFILETWVHFRLCSRKFLLFLWALASISTADWTLVGNAPTGWKWGPVSQLQHPTDLVLQKDLLFTGQFPWKRFFTSHIKFVYS